MFTDPPIQPELRAGIGTQSDHGAGPTAANDATPCPRVEAPAGPSAAFREEVAPLLAVLGYHVADPAAAISQPLPFGERRKTPRTVDRLAELEAQIAQHGDPSGLRHRLRRLLLSELELLGVVGRRREDRPLAQAATRALRG